MTAALGYLREEEMATSTQQDSRSQAFGPPPEPLLRFTETFSFKKFVEEHLVSPEEEELADMVRSSAHLVGQTRSGEVLYAWDRQVSGDESITTVGLFNHQTKSHHTIYQHDCKISVCDATINYEKTLLAFTIKEAAYEDDQHMYDSYIAEIQPQGRVFTLNIPSPNYRMLQFLHRESSQAPKIRMTSKTTQMSHLLVVIPSVLICLYHFKMQLIMLGAVMVGQPEKEILQKNFAWYQWDPHTQWLYYARFETNTSMVRVSVSGKHALLLSCENFSTPKHQLMFTVSLPLPYSEDLYSNVATYYDCPFAFILPVREMNLQVLYRRDGFWCVCLQHCTGVALELDQPDSSCAGSSEGAKIDYSVYILHNGHVLYGQVQFPHFISDPTYIHFMLVGCFVAAYIPYMMLHLLNVGPLIDPCHHLTFGSDYSSFAVFDAVPAELVDREALSCDSRISILVTPPSLTSAVSGSLMGDYNTAVIDCDSNTLYECNLNIPAFFQLFKNTSDPILKEDLLHLMVVGFRYHGMALSMIEHVCQTPMSMSDHGLFAEFIISSSFANFYFDCKKFFARQFPLTTAQTFHGKVCKNTDGGNKVLLKLRRIPNFVQQLLVQSDQRLVMATPEELLNYDPPRNQEFENLCFNVVLNQPEYGRIDIKDLPSLEESQQAVDASLSGTSKQQKGNKKGGVSSQQGSSASGILHKITTLSRRTGRHTSPVQLAPDPQQLLNFLSLDEDVVEGLRTKANNVKEQILMSLMKDLPLRARNIAYNTTKTYCKELEKQSCNLLLVIWQSLGFNSNNHPINSSLCRTPTTKERILFELLEAYQLAHLELGLPLPMGFQTLFICLGFLTLEIVMFLQYLRNDIFTPTKRFVELLIEDCEDGDSDEVFQVLCNLDYPLAKFAFSRWQDPLVQQLDIEHPIGSKRTPRDH